MSKLETRMQKGLMDYRIFHRTKPENNAIDHKTSSRKTFIMLLISAPFSCALLSGSHCSYCSCQ
uniref:Uncharacterized protein n=1 Tax=Rhizophora mucronata TaxID=61149 RepID=A0A2P2JTZ2_RHIMU